MKSLSYNNVRFSNLIRLSPELLFTGPCICDLLIEIRNAFSGCYVPYRCLKKAGHLRPGYGLSQNKLNQCVDTVFNPTIEPIRVMRKSIRKRPAGSLNTHIPISTVPTAPMPVHTA